MDIQKNITLASLDTFVNWPFLNKKKEYLHAKSTIDKFGLKNITPHTIMKALSTGSQQKIAIAKLLSAKPKLYVMDEPSISLDIASKVELFNIMNKLTHMGSAIFFVSSDLDELIGMCDRIYIMFDGRIVAEMNAKETDSVKILTYATGKWS